MSLLHKKIFVLFSSSQPNDVLGAVTVNASKNQLDKHWSNRDVLFNFNVDLTATGSHHKFVREHNATEDAGEEDYTCAHQNRLNCVLLISLSFS